MLPIAVVSIINYYLREADEYGLKGARTVRASAPCGLQEIKTSQCTVITQRGEEHG